MRTVDRSRRLPYYFAGTTDAAGRTSMRGFGRDFQQQIQARKTGFALINWGVRRTEKGIYWHEVGGDGTEFGPFGELRITLKRAGWIEGRAIDADTGEPVRLRAWSCAHSSASRQERSS